MKRQLCALFAVLAGAVGRRFGQLNAQEIANTVWALVTADWLIALVFTVLSSAVEQRLGKFSTQNLANTAWAYATAD